MKVSIKTRPRDKRTSYLLVMHYEGGVHKPESAGVWTYNHPRTKEERAHNEEANKTASLKKAEIEARLLRGDSKPAKEQETKNSKVCTLGDLLQEYKEAKDSTENTIKLYKRALTFIGESTKLSTLSAEMVNTAFLKLRETYKDSANNSTQLLYRSKLESLVKFGIEEGLVSRDALTSKVRKPRNNASEEGEALTEEERNKMFEEYKTKPSRWKRIFLFSCFTGLRYSDLLSLKWGDIQGEYLVKKMEKTECTVIVPLCDQAKYLLPSRGKAKETALVLDVPDKSAIKRDIQKWIGDKTRPVSIHTARHTFGTILAKKGVSIQVVCKLMGHKSINTTKRYFKIGKEDLTQAINMI